ncbi:hypothetical protein [Paenibacillus fonticola]|uniref:hypothetical protein n=1 Tax=Paenibacillus fonticola TaxID=379896 RepID=UPI0003762A54|nr:hypothetical protein [Paenibacillus fonticola]
MNTGSIDISINNITTVGTAGRVIFLNKKNTVFFEEQDKVLWTITNEVLEGICFIEYMLDIENQLFYFSDNNSEVLVKICTSNGVFETIKLNRTEKDDSDFYRSSFFPNQDGCLFVYEGGLIQFNNDGTMQWYKEHQYYDWFFTGINNGYALYESEHDGKWGYQIKTGEKKQFDF